MLSLLVSCTLGSQTIQAPDYTWWNKAKFGMFIHWGLYSVPADATDLNGNHSIAEWYLSNKQMKPGKYAEFAKQFNPVKFDAKAWVSTAKHAGMKYIVITTKHHDGFCMFDSRLTNFSVTKATNYHHDPLKDLAVECKKQGIQLCFYHSIMDWSHPDYIPRRKWDDRPTTPGSLNRYIDHMKGQLKELLTNYGKIGVIWFDGGWEHNAQELRSQEINDMIRQLQPGILINDRNQLPADFSTPEQTIPGNALPNGRPWETCMTINDTWGYARNDHNWKSSTDLIRKLIDIASKGGNFLLNVGPTDLGEFPSEIDFRLTDIGEWLRRNGSAIYGTTKSPFKTLPFAGRVTAKGNTLYVFTFGQPKGGQLELSGLKTPILLARDLTGGTVKISGDTLKVWPKTVDSAANVYEVRLAGKPVVDNFLNQPDSAEFMLPARLAEVIGATARYEEGDGKDNIGYWTNNKDKVQWEININKEGDYSVEVLYACNPESKGTTVSINGLTQQVENTGSWTQFEKKVFGVIRFSKGHHKVVIEPVGTFSGAVMNLKAVYLTEKQ